MDLVWFDVICDDDVDVDLSALTHNFCFFSLSLLTFPTGTTLTFRNHAQVSFPMQEDLVPYRWGSEKIRVEKRTKRQWVIA